MKTLLLIVLMCFTIHFSIAQSNTEKKVIKACTNHYEGDTSKLKASLQPTLNKFGFWKNEETGKYEQQRHMSYERAITYAKRVF